jgi:HTH-type transcriptional regulator/antitoxin HipB
MSTQTTGVLSVPPIGELLRAAREKAGITQAELSERTGLPVSRISEMENGKEDNPKLKKLQDYAKALGVPLWKLIKQLDEN